MANESSPETPTYLPSDFEVTDWLSVKPWYDELLDRPLETTDDLERWLMDWSELEAYLQEDLAWRYIRMTCDTQNKALVERYNDFVANISPHLTTQSHRLQQKYYDSLLRRELDPLTYLTLNRQVEKDIELFREENVPLMSEVEIKAQQFDTITGAATVMVDGQEFTYQQAGRFLESTDRSRREHVWHAVQRRRLQDAEALDQLFNELVELRTRIARNAGHDSYTTYKFLELGRFDFTPADCNRFHEAIEQVIKPVYLRLLRDRAERLGLDSLRPWDLRVDIYGGEPLQPFETADELLERSIEVMSRVRPKFGEMLRQMQQMQHLDLGSRKGKAPGGYNYPLFRSGVPFIFMNAVGTQSDLSTMVHEAGHAVHAFLTQDYRLNIHRDVPSEVAELASMSMELLTMDHWDAFYADPKALNRARAQQLVGALSALPWIATVDAFQTWVYDHPSHTEMERNSTWLQLSSRFQGEGVVDWTDLDIHHRYQWHRQLHIFTVPFYYIEYGFAQLGALQVWKNYRQRPEETLERFEAALRLGYTRTVPEIYHTAGVDFSFSPESLQELADFVLNELEEIRGQL